MVEGLFEFIAGLVVFAYLPSFPETCSFLSQADRVLAVARGKDGVDQDVSLVGGRSLKTKAPVYKFDLAQMLDALKDVRIWGISLAYVFAMAALDCLMLLVPYVTTTSFYLENSVLNGPDNAEIYKSITANEDSNIFNAALSGLPYLLGAFVAIQATRHLEDTEKKTKAALISFFFSSFGFVFMALVTPLYQGGGAAQYFLGLIPAVTGLMLAVPLILSYGMENAVEDTYRATVAAMLVGPGHALGVVIAGIPSLFGNSAAPTFSLVCWLCAAFSCASGLCVLGVRWYNQQEAELGWSRAPGLRRLLNDQDEAKAWDIELQDVKCLKTETHDDAWE